MSRWAIAAVAAVPVLLVILAIETVTLLAEPPAGGKTAEIYGDLFAHRAVRADVRGEPPVASVLESGSRSGAPGPGSAQPSASAAPVTGLRIPGIGVDAPTVSLNLTSDGAMDTPDNPNDIAWYDFTGKPGLGGNAVFSGHVDWHTGAPAVFRRLDELEPGDVIEAVLSDGTVISYEVIGAELYTLEQLDMRAVLASTATDTVTLITCGGAWSGTEYSHRLVVRGVRT